MPRYFIAPALLFSLVHSKNAFIRGGFAAVTGSVTDSSVLIPGVTAKATAVDIAFVAATFSNNA